MTLQFSKTTGALLYRESDGALMAECQCSDCPCHDGCGPDHDPYNATFPLVQITCDCSVGAGDCDGMIYGAGDLTIPMAFSCEGDGGLCGGTVACAWTGGLANHSATLTYDTATSLWTLGVILSFIALPQPPGFKCSGFGGLTTSATLAKALFDCDTGGTFNFSDVATLICIYESRDFGVCTPGNVSFSVVVAPP